MQATSDLNNKPNQNPQTHKPNKEKIERKKKLWKKMATWWRYHKLLGVMVGLVVAVAKLGLAKEILRWERGWVWCSNLLYREGEKERKKNTHLHSYNNHVYLHSTITFLYLHILHWMCKIQSLVYYSHTVVSALRP